MIEFTWDVVYRCNYRCSYCWWDPHWDALEREHPRYPSEEEWLAAWDRVHGRCGEARISMLGGEPWVYPGFPRLLESLSVRHRVFVTTNLSVGREALVALADRLDPARVKLSASFHPEFSSWEPFIEKLVPLAERGLLGDVLLVAHPSFLAELPAYARRCREAGARLRVWVFSGRFAGRDYPASYTVAERALLRDYVEEPAAEHHLERAETRGKLCYAGAAYANVKADGTAYRCGTVAALDEPLGNLLDPGFALPDAPSPCPARRCNCQEYMYLADRFEAAQNKV